MISSAFSKILNLVGTVLKKVPVIAFLISAALFLFGLALAFGAFFLILISIGAAFSDDEKTIPVLTVQAILIAIPTLFLVWRSFIYYRDSKNSDLKSLLADSKNSDKETGSFDIAKTEVESLFDNIRKQKDTVKSFSYAAASIAYLLLTLNTMLDVVPGWYVVTLSGSILVLAYYSNEYVKHKTEFDLKYFVSDDSDSLKNFLDSKKEIKKSIAIALVVLLAVNLNWAYRVNKSFSDAKEVAVNEVLSLQGQGWCADFADINVYDAGETVVKSGGWPCVKIASVSNLQFTKLKKNSKLCIDISFQVENGLPGQESFSESTEAETVCAVDNWYDDWTTDSFMSEIYDKYEMSSVLDGLSSTLCSQLYFRMTEEDKFTYC